MVNGAYGHLAEADQVQALVSFDEVHRFAGECLADEAVATAPLDLAAGSDASDLVVGVVPGILPPFGIGVRGSGPQTSPPLRLGDGAPRRRRSRG
jgi:hypothetical protein